MRFAIPLAVVVLLVVVLAIGLKLDPRHVPSPLIGKPAPAFELPQLDNAQSRLSPQAFVGRPVLVNYFASWCAECRVEHPLFLELSRQGIEVIGIAYKDEPDDTRTWLKRHGNPYRQVLVDREGKAGLDWGVYGVPESYMLDAQGNIVFKQVGAVTPQVWKEHLLPVFQQGMAR